MSGEPVVNGIERLTIRYKPYVRQAEHDLAVDAGLHPDFVFDCLTAIAEKEQRAHSALLGNLFPHLVSDGLHLADRDRRRLSAAWLALYGYISIVDFNLDKKGYLDARTSLSAAGLLGWGIATISQLTSDTPFAEVFLSNMRAAFSGQYEDLASRSRPETDRTKNDVDKNRAIVAVVAGYCAAAGEKSSRLISATELFLGPLQFLDDLQDLAEDIQEDNATTLVKIVRSKVSDDIKRYDEMALYSLLLSDGAFLDALRSIAIGIRQALLLLDGNQDGSLVWYFGYLSDQIGSVIHEVQLFQSGIASITEPELIAHIRQIVCHS
jgi:hypothetical protein